ncbi:hypothetical protein Mal15_36010 [Stieleria maiorica]|uniref:Uncharacterized protein n=1 Tax=Stieleria maiorica TaxID=2795974 RepID=A0A5B9MHK2_9BACT|nr:hypothetical protein [Stieleria maiorica]QEF99536.1 hypothetical protein Mal15_36010 [Stieleria maiorica]
MGVPESFSYIHLPCGQTTVISGPEFESVANPLSGIETTLCVHCEMQDDVSQFRWDGAEESIAEYYDRLLADIPEQELERAGRPGMFKYLSLGGVAGFAVGVLIAIALSRLGPIAAIVGGLIATLLMTTLGVLLGFMHFEKKVVAPVVKKYWNVDDVRLLVGR